MRSLTEDDLPSILLIVLGLWILAVRPSTGIEVIPSRFEYPRLHALYSMLTVFIRGLYLETAAVVCIVVGAVCLRWRTPWLPLSILVGLAGVIILGSLFSVGGNPVVVHAAIVLTFLVFAAATWALIVTNEEWHGRLT